MACDLNQQEVIATVMYKGDPLSPSLKCAAPVHQHFSAGGMQLSLMSVYLACAGHSQCQPTKQC